MLKKLFKYDFESACRIFLGIYGVIALLTIVGKIVFTCVPDILNNIPILSIFVPTAIVLAFGLVIGFQIVLIVRFYRSYFKDEGYLYHTLPVKPWQLVTSKLLTSVLLSLLGLVILVICGLILLAGEPAQNIMNGWGEIEEMIRMLFGISPLSLVLWLVLLLPISVASSFLMYFASIALGQVLIPKHRVIGAFVAYMIYYVAMQTLTSIPVFLYTFKTIGSLIDTGEADSMVWISGFYHFTYFISLGLTIIGCVVFFFITNYIMKKKLNLD